MKKALLPLAMAALPVSVFAAGETDVKVYGKVNLTLLTIEQDGKAAAVTRLSEDSVAELTSNSSRLGVKGKTKINDNLNAIYQMEFEVAVDDGDLDGDEFKQRNIYAGLQGGFGTLVAGKHDTPFKMAQGKIDLFNDLVAGDIKNVFTGENRTDNILIYTTPEMGAFSANLATILGEGDTETSINGSDDEQDGFFDALSISLNYAAGNFFVALAVDQDVVSSLELLREVEDTDLGVTLTDFDYNQRTDAVRLVGGVKLGDLVLNGMYQTAENANTLNDSDLATFDSEFDGFLVSAAYTLNDWILKAQYAVNEGDFKQKTTGNTFESEATQMVLGADYKLGKQTKLFGYYSNLEFELDNVISASAEEAVLALGFEHKF